jgi:hypothetical protein
MEQSKFDKVCATTARLSFRNNANLRAHSCTSSYKLQETVLESDDSDENDSDEEVNGSDEDGPINGASRHAKSDTNVSAIGRHRRDSDRVQGKLPVSKENSCRLGEAVAVNGIATHRMTRSTSLRGKPVPVLDSDVDQDAPEGIAMEEEEEEEEKEEADEDVPEEHLPTCLVEKIMASKVERGETFYLLKFKGLIPHAMA